MAVAGGRRSQAPLQKSSWHGSRPHVGAAEHAAKELEQQMRHALRGIGDAQQQLLVAGSLGLAGKSY